MILVLCLEVLEVGQQPLGLIRRKTGHTEPRDERALFRDLVRTGLNMPPDHLKLGLVRAHRSHRGFFRVRRTAYRF